MKKVIGVFSLSVMLLTQFITPFTYATEFITPVEETPVVEEIVEPEEEITKDPTEQEEVVEDVEDADVTETHVGNQGIATDPENSEGGVKIDMKYHHKH